ncbi:uncharacterized protein LOC101238609 isoform X1 [Hydra vulgaris]|uniref:uncharacterized protein LOC101238609 isoform X1 n=1 Tax=Hydra vulgaris TaxID=6087 RepID=UPI001F5FEA14|nr:uncharacterized protein LOC101238609 isoform X1 [Hydra vulgaris]
MDTKPNYTVQIKHGYTGFLQQLPIVFEILKNNPDKIVDDTAIERLLNWMEVISSNQSLVECCVDYLTCNEIWQHPVAFSVALRVGGYIGCYDLSQEINEIILMLLTRLQTHNLFSNATVQFSFFKCLASLAKNSCWYERIKKYLDISLCTFNTSYLYVKKSAVLFLVQYLQDENQCVYFVEYMANYSLSAEQLVYVLDTIIKLFEIKKIHSAQMLCSKLNIIKACIELILTEKHFLLLEELISLFSLLSRNGADYWNGLFKTEKKLEDTLFSFVKAIKLNDFLNHYVPALCSSLIQCNFSFYFPETWNSTLLKVMLDDIFQENDSFLSPFHDDYNKPPMAGAAWKKYLIVAIDFMNVIERMSIPLQTMDHMFATLLMDWQIFLFKVLQISLSCGLDEKISNNYISLINDKKITRLCCAYIKSMKFQDLNIVVNEKLACCIVISLQSHAEVPQVTSSLLELLSRYISESDTNFSLITLACKANNICLAEILNMKLWDISWEVKDSLLDVLIQAIKGAVKGYKCHHEFLVTNLFWCKVMPLMNDNESYIRSKTIEFVTQVVLFEPMWVLFQKENSLPLENLWKKLEEDFTSPARQDDFFTRRSVLEMLLCCSNHSNAYSDIFTNKLSDSCMKSVKESVFRILQNCANDLDWEVRKLNIILWTSVISRIEKNAFAINDFLDFVIENNFILIILLTLCDVEYAVQIESLKCLRLLQRPFINDKKFDLSESFNYNVKSLEEFETYLKTMDLSTRKNIVSFIKRLDLDLLLMDVNVLDDTVKSDPVSFLEDIISSAKENDSNLLDCY